MERPAPGKTLTRLLAGVNPPFRQLASSGDRGTGSSASSRAHDVRFSWTTGGPLAVQAFIPLSRLLMFVSPGSIVKPAMITAQPHRRGGHVKFHGRGARLTAIAARRISLPFGP